MASPGLTLGDIEAQTSNITETLPAIATVPDLVPDPQPAIAPDPPPALPTNTSNPELPTTAVPQPQATNESEHHNGNAPAQQTAENSQGQRGMSTFLFHQLQSHSCTR